MSRYDDLDSPEFESIRSSRYANMIDAAELGIQCHRLRALNAELVEMLKRTNGLVGRGFAEGAYKDTCGGNDYADRVMNRAQELIAKAGQ